MTACRCSRSMSVPFDAPHPPAPEGVGSAVGVHEDRRRQRPKHVIPGGGGIHSLTRPKSPVSKVSCDPRPSPQVSSSHDAGRVESCLRSPLSDRRLRASYRASTPKCAVNVLRLSAVKVEPGCVRVATRLSLAMQSLLVRCRSDVLPDLDSSHEGLRSNLDSTCQ